MTRPSRPYDALAETGDEAEPLDYIRPVTCADNDLGLGGGGWSLPQLIYLYAKEV